MPIDYEDAQKNLGELIKWYADNVSEHTRNEATTRLHLIDCILFECLGWERNDCKSEERVNGKYIDYSLHCPECLLIVEAKKEGTHFELPIGMTRPKYGINFFSRQKQAKGVYKAIEQAISYCQSRGTPYGAVCNGHQLIAFIGSRNDGRPPLQGQALVFDSLQTLNDNFLLVWQSLSKPGIMSRRLSLELQEAAIAPVPEKLSKRIPHYPGFKKRNPLQTDLQILSELFIEDIAKVGAEGEEEDFLRQCYCESGALSQYAVISKELLLARYSVLFQQATEGPSLAPVRTKKGLNQEFLAQSLSRRPILLIGDIGVGKTIFIKHLYKVRVRSVFANALVFYVDFGSRPTIEEDLKSFIANEIIGQLLEEHGIDIYERNFVHGVLHRDLEKFEKGICGDIREFAPETFRIKQVAYLEERLSNKDEYIRLCLTHISKGRKKQLVVFLDNVDQRPYEFQEHAFLVGQSMADNWPVAVFISMRPETFYRSRVSGIIGAYHPRAFTIAPPRVDEVVSKRLKYGITLLERSAGLEFLAVSVRSENLSDYLKVLVHSFSNNKHLIRFLDNVCGGNVRLALDFVRAFIGSGHVDTQKILNIYHETGSYLVPLHEFLRAVTYGDHEYYSPDASEILNLFDISTADGKEHFLSPILLAQLDSLAQDSTTEGFVPVSNIYSYMQGLGFNPYQIDWAIKRLVRRNLIELPTKAREDERPEPRCYYRITTVGSYYVKRLITRFAYVDAMMVDTPMVDPKTRVQIADANGLADRLDRAKVFCDYLDAQWEPFSEQELPFHWPLVRRTIGLDIEYISGKISVREDVIEAD